MSSKELKPRRYRVPVGLLRHEVTLQVWTDTGDDSHGHDLGQWSDLATVWGFVEPLQGRTIEAAHQLYDLATHRVTINYRDDVTKANRVKFGDRYFGVGFVRNVYEGNHTLELLCSESDP